MPTAVTTELDGLEATDFEAAPCPARVRTRRQARLRLRPPAMGTLFALCFAVAGWRTGLSRLQDNSFLWHLKTGHWILDHGIPHADIYSFTAPGHPWIAQSWLAEMLYAVLDRAFGGFGVRVLGGVTGGLIAYLVYRLAERLTGDRTRAVLLTFAALGASFTLWSERPLFLGILAMVGLVWVVEVPGSVVGRRPMLSVPLLMWGWVNIHGSFAMGFAYLGLHLAGRWLDGAPPWQGRERRLAQAALLAFALCLVNPYGFGLITFPIHLLSRGDTIKSIVEWRSPDFRTLRGMGFAVWIAVFVACLAAGRHRCSRRDLVVTLPFLFLGLWAQRNIAVAPLIGLAVVARSVAVGEGDQRPESRLSLNWAVAGFVLLLGVSWTAEAAAVDPFNFRPYPVDAMEAVEKAGLLGPDHRLLTTDGWSAYVIHKYWPTQRIFMDDRYDMFPTTLSDDMSALLRAERDWRKILDRHRIEAVVWKTEHALSEFLELDDGWRLIHRDKLASVYVRSPR